MIGLLSAGRRTLRKLVVWSMKLFSRVTMTELWKSYYLKLGLVLLAQFVEHHGSMSILKVYPLKANLKLHIKIVTNLEIRYGKQFIASKAATMLDLTIETRIVDPDILLSNSAMKNG